MWTKTDSDRLRRISLRATTMRWALVIALGVLISVPALYGFWSLCVDINQAIGMGARGSKFAAVVQLMALIGAIGGYILTKLEGDAV